MGLAERWDVSVTVPAVFVGLLTGLLLRRKKTGRSWIWWLLPVCVLGGFVRAQDVRRACDRECFLALDGKAAAVEGTVCTLQKRQDGWAFGLEDCILYPAEGETDSGKLMGLLVYTETADRPLLGSRVRAEGTMKAIDMARNPGEFDYRLYYRAKKQNYRMFADGWEAVEGGRDFNRYREFLYSLSVKAGEILDRTAHGRDAGIYRAVLLGDRAELNGEVRSLYQSSGISHLLAISGVKTLKLDIPLVPETRINWAFVPLHIAIIYILKLCLDEEIIPRCRFPCSRGYFTKCINWQKKQ